MKPSTAILLVGVRPAYAGASRTTATELLSYVDRLLQLNSNSQTLFGLWSWRFRRKSFPVRHYVCDTNKWHIMMFNLNTSIH